MGKAADMLDAGVTDTLSYYAFRFVIARHNHGFRGERTLHLRGSFERATMETSLKMRRVSLAAGPVLRESFGLLD